MAMNWGADNPLWAMLAGGGAGMLSAGPGQSQLGGGLMGMLQGGQMAQQMQQAQQMQALRELQMAELKRKAARESRWDAMWGTRPPTAPQSAPQMASADPNATAGALSPMPGQRPGSTPEAANRLNVAAPNPVAMIPPNMRQLIAMMGPEDGPKFLAQLQAKQMETGQWETTDVNGIPGQRNRLTGEFKPFPGAEYLNPAVLNARKDIARAGQSISNTNVDARSVGNIPPGYRLVTGQNGELRMELIPGSPTAEAKGEQQEQAGRTGNIVLTDIGRMREKIEKAPWYAPTTGLIGNWLKDVGGTRAADVKALGQTIRSNIGFDRLQVMRQQSPTGGALGQVTERELSELQSVLGSLEQSQSEGQLLENLDRLEKLYSDIVKKAAAYPNAARFGFTAPATKTDEGWQDLGNGVRIRRKQ